MPTSRHSISGLCHNPPSCRVSSNLLRHYILGTTNSTLHSSLRMLDPSLLHVCLSVVLQFVLDALVVGAAQQFSIGGRHTCAGTTADEQLQHVGMAWGGGNTQSPRKDSMVCNIEGIKLCTKR